MDGLIVNALVPLSSVLLGAWLTYVLNVKSRRRTNVEDLFNQAIGAVAVADSSSHYIRDTTGLHPCPTLSIARCSPGSNGLQ